MQPVNPQNVPGDRNSIYRRLAEAVARTISNNPNNAALPVRISGWVCLFALVIPVLAEAQINISLDPGSASLTTSHTQQFTTRVEGSANTAVTWTLNRPVGAISTTGLYTAPASIDKAQTVTVTATSVATPARFASVDVTITPPVTISLTPASAILRAGQSQQFTPTVGGTLNTDVTWTLNAGVGTMSSTGLYTAPSTIAATRNQTVTATSVADSSKSASARLVLVSPLTILSTAIPGAAAGVPFRVTLEAVGSLQPYTWIVSSGTLPGGLTLMSSSGIISGTPMAGLFTFTIRVNSQAGDQVSQTYLMQVGDASSSYYISSQNGNDSWSGVLPSPNSSNTNGPFRTLGRAQDALRGSSLIKTATVRAGVYSVASNWFLNPPDSGELWIAYPGETAILDGSTTGGINLNNGGAGGVHNVTFKGLNFQNMGPTGLYVGGSDSLTIRSNTFQNCNQTCISGGGLKNSIIDSNTINGQSPASISGPGSSAYYAINLWDGSSNNQITHNLIENCQGSGIGFGAGPNDLPNNNNIVDRNILRNVNDGNVVDAGAIYFYDMTHSATGLQITNNIIDGNGGTNYRAGQAKAIYLDAATSHALVSGNVCRSCGEWAWQINWGDHNTIENNIFDLSSSGTQLGLYQAFSSPDYGMAGNVFTKNIIYFSGSPPSLLYTVGINPNDALPASSRNLYYSAIDVMIPNGKVIVDSSPFYANPEFTQPAAGNYLMPLSSPAYTLIGFQPLATDQGPLGYGSGALGNGNGALAGSFNTGTTTVNLSVKGTTDWVHWGASPTRKKGVAPQISSYAVVGTGDVKFYWNDPRALTWSDGTPVSAGMDNSGIYVESPSNGLSFTVPADTTKHVLTVVVGGWYSGGTLTAHLSDGSAADFVNATPVTVGQYDNTYTLTYSAASSGETLTVTWVDNSGLGGNVTMGGAALQQSH